MTWMRYTIGGPITKEAAEELQELLDDNFGGNCGNNDDVQEAIAKGRAVEVAEHDPDDDSVDAFIAKHNLCFLYTEDHDEAGGTGYWRKPDGTTGTFQCDEEGEPIVTIADLRTAAEKGQSLAELLAEFEEHVGRWMPPLTLRPSDADLLRAYGYQIATWAEFKAATDRPAVLLKRAKPHHKDEDDSVVYDPQDGDTGWLLVGDAETIAAETVEMIRSTSPTTGPLAATPA